MDRANAPPTLDRSLIQAVATALDRAIGGATPVSVRSDPSPFATLFPAEVLHVSLDDGRVMRLFRKTLGSQPNHPDKQPPDREVRVYRQWLNDDRLAIVRFYGSRANAADGTHELYLEYVDDWNLKYHDLELWFVAARRLAHLHAHFARCGDLLHGCEFLIPLDGDYFMRWAGRACDAIAPQSAELAGRLVSLLSSYRPVAALLARQQPTLVHNDLAPKNVLADRSVQAPRICFIDWEMAGVGCGLLDLAHLKYGLDPDAERKMISAYRNGLAESNSAPGDEQEFGRVLAACELHKTLYRLAHSPAWRLPVVRLTEWVGDAERLLSRAQTGWPSAGSDA
jgi:hypothetical protein